MRNQNSIKTHCPRGHEYTPENTRRDAKGRRYCRECQSRWQTKNYGCCGWSGCNEKCEINRQTRKPYYYCEEHKKARKMTPSRSREHRAKEENQQCLDRYYQWRNRFMDTYGGACNCCGESIREFLTLDHVEGNGAGNRDRKKGRGPYFLYRDAVMNFDPTKYQILCANCNMAKGAKGICPHQLSKKEL